MGKRVSEDWHDKAWKALVNAECALYEAVQASEGALRRHLVVCHAEHQRAMSDLCGYKAEWQLAWRLAQCASRIRSRE